MSFQSCLMRFLYFWEGQSVLQMLIYEESYFDWGPALLMAVWHIDCYPEVTLALNQTVCFPIAVEGIRKVISSVHKEHRHGGRSDIHRWFP